MSKRKEKICNLWRAKRWFKPLASGYIYREYTEHYLSHKPTKPPNTELEANGCNGCFSTRHQYFPPIEALLYLTLLLFLPQNHYQGPNSTTHFPANPSPDVSISLWSETLMLCNLRGSSLRRGRREDEAGAGVCWEVEGREKSRRVQEEAEDWWCKGWSRWRFGQVGPDSGCAGLGSDYSDSEQCYIHWGNTDMVMFRVFTTMALFGCQENGGKKKYNKNCILKIDYFFQN